MALGDRTLMPPPPIVEKFVEQRHIRIWVYTRKVQNTPVQIFINKPLAVEWPDKCGWGGGAKLSGRSSQGHSCCGDLGAQPPETDTCYMLLEKFAVCTTCICNNFQRKYPADTNDCDAYKLIFTILFSLTYPLYATSISVNLNVLSIVESSSCQQPAHPSLPRPPPYFCPSTFLVGVAQILGSSLAKVKGSSCSHLLPPVL